MMILLLLVTRRSCGCGVWCSPATRGGSLLVCWFRHAEYKSVLFASGVTNMWRFIEVTKYVALRRGQKYVGYCRSVTE